MNIEKASLKSQPVQLLLTVLLGPFGLFYSNWVVAVVLSALFIPSIGAFLLGFFVGWPVAIITGFFCVKNHNKKVQPYIDLKVRKIACEKGINNGNV